MKTALVFLGLCALAIAGTINVGQQGKQSKVADKLFLEKQKQVLRLLKHVLQTNVHKDQVEVAQNYNIENNLQQYGNQQVVREFLNLNEERLLPRGEVFSVMYEEQRQQVVALIGMLISANDWNTFYNTACWARQNVNEGMFVYAMHVAVLHREDTQGIVLPAIYEIYPYLFVNSEVIDQAYELRMRNGVNNNQVNNQGNKQGADVNNQQRYYIQANYSGWYLNSNPEQTALSYLTEDVGLNAYYYYYNLDYPFWMGGEEHGLNKDRRGELYYYVHQQLLARYYLERLSNNQGSIPVFDWNEPIKTGYVPSMRYHNGLELPTRPAYAHLVYNPHNQAYTNTAEDNVLVMQEIEDYERRIRDAIDSGIVITENGQKVNLYNEDGFDVLGRIIEASPDSPNNRYYGQLLVLARQVLGYSAIPVDSYKINPSVLEQFESSLRDPVFYQLYKRITYYFLRYQSNLPSYTQTQLLSSGIKIENVEIDKLITYLDTYEWEITNALPVSSEQEVENENVQIWVRQPRLNHKLFTYKINVNSNQATDVVVRVFLGPKLNEQGQEIPLNENRVNFVELDQFVQTLQAGQNVIERNSQQTETVRDRTPFRVLYQRVMNALQGQGEFQLDMTEAHNGFPNRLVLPRGTEAGQVYQLYVYISQRQQGQQQQQRAYDNVISAGVGSGARYVDNLPMGYPLNRQIQNERTFMVPNSYIRDIVIQHRTESEINAANRILV